MVKWIMFLICSICIDAYSQVLKNVVTDEHSRVEATNIYLIVPEGFTWINRSREFLNAAINASITINRIETPVYVVHDQMSKENALAQGIMVLSEREIKLGDFRGYQFETNRNTHSEKFKSKLLVFGNDQETYSIQFIFPASRNDVESIANITLEGVAFKELITDSKSRYSMDFKKFHFELLESKNNVSIYQSVKHNLRLTVNQFYTKREEDAGMIFYNKMQQLPYSSVMLDEAGIEEITISDLSGVHATLNALDEKSNPIYIYQLLISKAHSYFLIIGVSTQLKDVNIYKELTKSFTLQR